MGIMLWSYRLLMSVSLPIAMGILAVRDRIRGKQRPAWARRFGRNLPALDGGGLWIHAVSVGEVEVARQLIATLGDLGHRAPITVTVTTAAGLDLARKHLSDRAVILPSPVDLPGPVGRVFDRARPAALVLVETELWPELLHQAGRRQIPAIVVNARLSDRSFRRYRRIKAALTPLLSPVTLVLTRDRTDADRFEGLGFDAARVRVGGNLKYDLEPDDRPLPWETSLERWSDGRPVVVAGSTVDGEEAPVLDGLGRATASDGRGPLILLAPRHPERFDLVADQIIGRGLSLIRRSDQAEWDRTAPDVVLLDTIGELARAFRLADIAFIGGSLVPRGGHNPLEPATWGVPVLTGPSIDNFEEVYRDMASSGAARFVADAAELGRAVQQWLDDPDAARTAGAAGFEVLRRNRGATEAVCTAILRITNGASTP